MSAPMNQLSAADAERYLIRLGLPAQGPPSVAGLRALHAAHVERVAYETLEIHLGRPTTVDPLESVARILRGRGGYCFHLNGAFSTLLRHLGYDVTWHRGGVQGSPSDPAPGAVATHLVLTVVCEGSPWLVDAGLGDGPREPLPLRTGSHRQGDMAYRLGPSAVVPGGWRFDHDPSGAFHGMDFAPDPAGPADFVDQHRYLSTSPDSGFVRTLSVLRRDAGGVDELQGCVLGRTTGSASSKRELTTPGEWFAALEGVFGLDLGDTTRREREALWTRVRAGHEQWQAARQSA